LELFNTCKENLVRVHEELTTEGVALSYPALTAFCRKQGIGQAPIMAAGQYHFEPGEEMQHDTSPHEVQLAGKKRKVQTASGVLCYSRMLFFQCYPTFQRFDCKVFLTDTVRYFGGASERVMIDNTHVVVLRRGALWAGARDGSRARDGRVWRTFRVSVRSACHWECQSFGPCGTTLLVHRKQLSGRAHVLQLGGSESAGARVV
jgi:hypothetical protein